MALPSNLFSTRDQHCRFQLRELRPEFPDTGYIFSTERGGPFTPDAVNRLIKRIGERAGFDMVAATP